MERVFTGTQWEPKVGYCRATKTGKQIFVSGCAPVGAEGADAYGQAKRCLEIAVEALKQLGAGIEHVVRTRMFVTDISRWPEFGRAHGEVFATHPPATTMVEVKALIDPRMLIEIEADAILP